MNIKKNSSNAVIHILLIVLATTMLVPFIWMVLTAFKSNAEATSVNPFVILPTTWRMDSFDNVFRNFDFLRLYIITLWMMAGRILAAVLTATMAGYAFARLNFRGKNLAFSLVLFQMMVPAQIFIIPQFLMVSRLGQLNTIFGLVFPGLVTAFGTFLLRQSYMTLPRDLEDAAKIDGCNIGQTFLFIMLPLTRSSMVALGIFTAIFAFRDLMWPMIVNTNQSWHTLSVALATMQGQFSTNFPELMAASLIACIPMIVIYLLFQKQFIEGISTSGGKL